VSTPDRIVVTADLHELRVDDDGVVDVFASLQRQFFWADTVIVSPDAMELDRDDEVLEGEIVS
jgi:hypothetical protein